MENEVRDLDRNLKTKIRHHYVLKTVLDLTN